MVLPLLASCLVLALIAGTLLTVFTAAGPGEGDLPAATLGTARPSHSVPANGARAGGAPALPADTLTAVASGKLPAAGVQIAGALEPVRSLVPAVLALVPAGCKCAVAVNQLISQARTAGVPVYLVSARGALPAVRQLALLAPGPARAAEDSSGVLYGTYRPEKLTALLAYGTDAVRKAAPLQPGFRLGHQLGALKAAASSPSATSNASAPASSAPAPTSTPASTSAARASPAPAPTASSG
jgi:hypothetical protein